MAIVDVLNTSDSGDGSLRAALATAAAGDTIDLSGVSGTITLTSQLDVTKNLTLVGPGRDVLTISGNRLTRVMQVADNVTATLRDLTIARGGGGNVLSGGGIYSNGDLVLDRVTVRNNLALYGYGGSGGGVYVYNGSLAATDCEFLDNVAGAFAGGLFLTNGNLALLRCTFARNTAGGFGGDYYGIGGAMRINLSGVAATASIVNCTISGNASYGSSPAGGAARGGGLELDVFSGRLDIVNTTITNNHAGVGSTRGHGGGVYCDPGGDSTPRVFFTNTIIAGNAAATQYPDIDAASGRVRSLGHNLIGVRDGWAAAPGVTNTTFDRVGTAAGPLDPKLAPLANNGGLTLTQKPLLDSPAINRGDDAALTFGNVNDQTGAPRSEAPEIGAVEGGGPHFTSTPPRNVYLEPGESFSYTAAFSHTEPGWIVSVSATSAPDWLTLANHGNGTATLSGIADATPGSYTIVLAATAGPLTGEQTFVLHVGQTNVAPAFVSDPPVTTTADTRYSYKLAATDPNGDALDFTATTLPTWLTLEDHGDGTATLHGNPSNTHAGANAVSIRVSDGVLTAVQTFSITVAYLNHTPAQPGAQLPTLPAFQTLAHTIIAYDADAADKLTLTATTKPAWMTFVDNGDGTATLGGSPTNVHAGQNTLTVFVSDGKASMSRTYFFNVTYVNRAPAFTTPATLPGGFAREAYATTVLAADPDGDRLTVIALSQPSWLHVIDNGDGTATLSSTTPTPNNKPGVYTFTLRVSDGSLTADRAFSITLPNRTPEVSMIAPPPGATADQPFSGILAASDADQDGVMMTLLSKPSWLNWATLDAATARLTGTPTNAYAGDNTVVVRLTDGTTTIDRTITIPVLYVNHAPMIPSGSFTVQSESPYSGTFHANDVDDDALSISAIGHPAWLSVTDNGDGSVTFAGTPTNANAGTTSFTVRVSDGTAFIDQTYTVTVNAINHAPSFTSTATATVVAGTPFFHAITTADVDGDALTITAVSLPAWMTLTDNGNGTATLTGVAADADGGINPVVLRVGDGDRGVEQALDVTVLVERFRLVDGVLSVSGGTDADTIQVWIRDGSTIRALRNGVIKNYPLSSVREVQLLGFDGNDSLTVNTRAIAAYVLGGAGNDTLVGGDEADNFVGGGGKDLLDSGGGADRLDGGAGNDKLLGQDGDDRLYGGDGNDVLVSGNGTDQLFGQAGDDLLYARDAVSDLVNGGEGMDSAQLDLSDIREDLLVLLA